MKRLLLALLIGIIISGAGLSGEISLTVYNSNLALVHEFREIDFKKGVFTHEFTDIPALIIPTSVHFRGEGVYVLEQNYEYDLASPEKIVDKFIGEKIRAFTEQGEMFEGTLQPSGWGGFVLVDDKGKVLILEKTKLVRTEFSHMPPDFLARPTLVWQLEAKNSGKKKAEVSYLTEGMNWNAEYVAVTGGDKLGFTGWVSIDNRSGETFENAKLKLMAGEIHRIYERNKMTRIRAGAQMDYESATAGAAQFEEKEFFEYHLYTLQRPATLKNNQTKQISLFPEAMVDFERRYYFDSFENNPKVKVYLVFRNSESKGLGIPLPAGKIRIYQTDEDGSQEFIGEDTINHTPRDEEVKVMVGKAFDIVGEKVKTDTRQISRNIREEDWEIKLRNRKKEAVEIKVREYHSDYWEILSTTHKYEKIDANRIEFTIKTPPHKEGEELKIKYTVRYTYK